MDVKLVNKIKRLVIIALASDDNLVETLVLKGGNAIDLAYSDTETTYRASYDLDYSIDEEQLLNINEINSRIENALTATFTENGYILFDYKFTSRPKNLNKFLKEFWGGYKVEFKVIQSNMDELELEQKRRRALPLNPNHSPVFELEFSRYEYTKDKKIYKVDGYAIYIYTQEMIVFEKVRAICQQLPQYRKVIPSMSSRARARDFYDIYLIMNMFKIDPNTNDNIRLIENIFSAKRVPTELIKEIRNFREIHASDWESVKDTVAPSEDLNDFDFYFNFVCEKFEGITFP